MTGITLAELECIKDIIEADIDRSEWAGENLLAQDWKCVDLMSFYKNRASAYAKLKVLTQG